MLHFVLSEEDAYNFRMSVLERKEFDAWHDRECSDSYDDGPCQCALVEENVSYFRSLDLYWNDLCFECQRGKETFLPKTKVSFVKMNQC